MRRGEQDLPVDQRLGLLAMLGEVRGHHRQRFQSVWEHRTLLQLHRGKWGSVTYKQMTLTNPDTKLFHYLALGSHSDRSIQKPKESPRERLLVNCTHSYLISLQIFTK